MKTFDKVSQARVDSALGTPLGMSRRAGSVCDGDNEASVSEDDNFVSILTGQTLGYVATTYY